jgi:hypothetical protein
VTIRDENAKIYPNSLFVEPVRVKISKGETLFFAENEDFGIFTTGKSREEAISNFSEQIIHFYNHYKQLNWNRATGEALRIKKLFKNLVGID